LSVASVFIYNLSAEEAL